MNNSNYVTIHLGKSARGIFEGFEGSECETGSTRSERLDTICASYLAMMGAAVPGLDRSEWETILNIFSSSMIGSDPYLYARMLHAFLQDDGSASLELIQKIKDLDLLGRFAVLEVMHRFFAVTREEFDIESLIASIRGNASNID